jgi:hypothetical protein
MSIIEEKVAEKKTENWAATGSWRGGRDYRVVQLPNTLHIKDVR